MKWAELIAMQVRPMHTYMHSQHTFTTHCLLYIYTIRLFLGTLGRVLQNYVWHRFSVLFTGSQYMTSTIHQNVDSWVWGVEALCHIIQG